MINTTWVIVPAAVALTAFGAAAANAGPVSGVHTEIVYRAPQPAQLSEAELTAIELKDAGCPYVRADYKSAMRKINQAEKYSGLRNMQKRGC